MSLEIETGCVMTIFLTVANFHRTLRESRDFYAKLGWDVASCSIGTFGDQIRMACDTGAVDYTFLESGRVRVETHGRISKLMEFVKADCEMYVERHNLSRRSVQV